jgi:crossover junction endodeoxyribonuclease RusA
MLLELPFPPSVNHYLGRRGHQTYKTAKAKAYNQEVILRIALGNFKANFNTPLDVTYLYWFPDHRKRDIANYEKVLTDSIVTAGVMVDDHLIHRLTQQKMGVRDDGLVTVIIKPFLP